MVLQRCAGLGTMVLEFSFTHIRSIPKVMSTILYYIASRIFFESKFCKSFWYKNSKWPLSLVPNVSFKTLHHFIVRSSIMDHYICIYLIRFYTSIKIETRFWPNKQNYRPVHFRHVLSATRSEDHFITLTCFYDNRRSI